MSTLSKAQEGAFSSQIDKDFANFLSKLVQSSILTDSYSLCVDVLFSDKKGPIYSVEWHPDSSHFCVVYGCILSIMRPLLLFSGHLFLIRTFHTPEKV